MEWVLATTPQSCLLDLSSSYCRTRLDVPVFCRTFYHVGWMRRLSLRGKANAILPGPRGKKSKPHPLCLDMFIRLSPYVDKNLGEFCRLCRHTRERFTSSLAVALSYSKLKSPNDRGFVFFDRFGKNCLVPVAAIHGPKGSSPRKVLSSAETPGVQVGITQGLRFKA